MYPDVLKYVYCVFTIMFNIFTKVSNEKVTHFTASNFQIYRKLKLFDKNTLFVYIHGREEGSIPLAQPDIDKGILVSCRC